MTQYDTTFIIDGALEQAQRESLIEKYEKSLKKLGGKFDRTVRWGLRELAYEIKKCTHGYYVMFYYNAEPAVIKKFESELNLNEHILRYMTLLFDGKHPDHIKDETGQITEAVAKDDIPEPPETLKEESIEVSDDDVSEIVEDKPENDEAENVVAEETDTSSPDTDADNETVEAAETEESQKKEDE